MEYMEYITRDIKICIWALGFGPHAWALGTLGPKKLVWATCMGPWDPWPINKNISKFEETGMTFCMNQYDILHEPV